VIYCEAGLCHGQSTWCFSHPLSSVFGFSRCLHVLFLSHKVVNHLYSTASSLSFTHCPCLQNYYKIISSMPSWRNRCSSQLCFLYCIVLKMDFSSPILFRTSSIVIFSVQLIFSILLHTVCFCMFLVGYSQTHEPVIPPGRLAQIDLSCVDVP